MSKEDEIYISGIFWTRLWDVLLDHIGQLPALHRLNIKALIPKMIGIIVDIKPVYRT